MAGFTIVSDMIENNCVETMKIALVAITTIFLIQS